MSRSKDNTIVLICGYARAGKDTFADGMLKYSNFKCGKPALLKMNFADHLKNVCNTLITNLKLDGDFWDTQFKNVNRDLLVSVGRFARSIDVDVFPNALCANANEVVFGLNYCDSIVVADWRYLNELNVINEMMRSNWNIVTIYVETENVLPANEEEGVSIGNIIRNHSFSHTFSFKQNASNDLMTAGFQLAAQLNL